MRMVILFLASGTAACHLQAALLPSMPLFLGALVFLTAALLTWRHRRVASRCFLLLAAFAGGMGWAGWRAEIRLAQRLPAALERQDFLLDGRIAGLVQQGENGLRFVFEADGDIVPGVPAGRILVSWYASPSTVLPGVRGGERWRLLLRLRQPHSTFNPPLKIGETWHFNQGIGAVAYVRNSPENARLALLAPGPWSRIDHWRERIRERFVAALPDSPTRGVLVALVVGDQASVADAQWRLFRRTGTIHLMSISGLHVTLVATLVAGLAGFLWRRCPRLMLRCPAQKAVLPFGVLAAGVYVLIAGAGIPAVRTFCMLTAAAVALLGGRGGGASGVMAAALLAVLIYDPWAMLASGFWLSFGAVAALVLIARSVRQATAGQTRWRAAALVWVRSQWAVTLLALPVLLGIFQQFSLVSPLANVVAIPVVSLLVTPLAMLFALFPLPALAILADLFVQGLMHGLEWLAQWPVSVWQQAAPPMWLVVASVGAALWNLLPRGLPARRVALLTLIPLVFHVPPRPAPGELHVNVLDVGQGLAVHLQTQRHDFLYDTGPSYMGASDAGERIVLPWLQAKGVSRLDTLVVSHADKDHSGGLASILEGIGIGAWYSSIGDVASYPQAAPHRPCHSGEGWEADGVKFLFLHPAPGDGGNTNDRSCVLHVASAHGALLLTGDIGLRAEQRLLDSQGGAVRADVMIAPHHGSKTSSGKALIHAVAPQHAVFTAGYLSRFGHPAPEVLTRYRSAGARIHRSDRDGLVSFVFARNEVRSRDARAQYRRYWHDSD